MSSAMHVLVYSGLLAFVFGMMFSFSCLLENSHPNKLLLIGTGLGGVCGVMLMSIATITMVDPVGVRDGWSGYVPGFPFVVLGLTGIAARITWKIRNRQPKEVVQ